MAYSFLGSTLIRAAGSGATTITSPAVDTALADLILLAAAVGGASAFNFSDNKSNLYVPAGNTGNSPLYYCQGANVGSGHQFTFSPGTGNPSMVALWFKGSAAGPLDQSAVIAAFTGAPGNYTPTTDDQLVIGWHWAVYSTLSATCSPAPFSTNALTAEGGGNTWQCGISWEIQTTKTTRNPTWAFTPNPGSACESGVVSFRAAAGAPAGPPPRSEPFIILPL